METLRELFQSLGLRDVRTYVQSGNVIFQTDEADVGGLGPRLEGAIQQAFGFHSDVILRTLEELRAAVRQNPFAGRIEVNPAKLLVTFLAVLPDAGAIEMLRGISVVSEEVVLTGRELYIYFPEGMGRSRLISSGFDKRLGTAATGRNWNTVTRLLEIGDSMDTVSEDAGCVPRIERDGGVMARKSKDKGNKDTKPPNKQKDST